jgi:ATP-dependent helicase/nuclease subunit B
MRRKLGLPPAERRVGLSAHDFVMAASAPAVLLTRSRKVDGVPTRPSRWLARLDALLAGDERWADAKRTSWAQWHGELDRPGSQQPIAKPRPTPPVAERPRRLAVTQIETLIRDPYAIWAREILGLRPLDPLDPLPSAGERGSVIHDALRRFHDAVAADPDADRLATLLACGEQAFAALLARPAVRAIWWPRFARAAAWLVEWERGRRAAGITPVAAEIRGALTLARPGGEFRLDARADRIDRLADGSLSILDWKTGQVPSARQMVAGLAPQLALEAVIAGERGFAGGVGGVVGELVHVRLTGGTPAGEDLPYAPTGTQPTVSGLIEAARDGLARLVDEFDRPDKPYLSRPRPRFQRHAGRYDHLARVREWSDAVESEAP